MLRSSVDFDMPFRVVTAVFAASLALFGCFGGSSGGDAQPQAGADASEIGVDDTAPTGEDRDTSTSPTDTREPEEMDASGTDAVEPDTTEPDPDLGGADADTGEIADTAPGGPTDTARQDGGDAAGARPDFETVSCASASVASSVQVGPRYSFSPPTVMISTGEVVQWTWAASVTLQHNVTADDDGSCGDPNPNWFQSTASAAAGTTFCVRFNKAGTWNYHCTVGNHCSRGMKGTVEVN